MKNKNEYIQTRIASNKYVQTRIASKNRAHWNSIGRTVDSWRPDITLICPFVNFAKEKHQGNAMYQHISADWSKANLRCHIIDKNFIRNMESL